MAPYTYGDIPDEIPTKPYTPLAKHIWKLHQEFGYDLQKRMIVASVDYMYAELKERLDTTISAAKAIIDGDIKNPQKIVSYTLFPPVLSIRGDLAQGLNKLLFGESTDTTFVVLNDAEDGKIFFILNAHCEDGIPVDWWLVKPDDDLLDRRHLRLGYKIRDLPAKIKFNFTDIGNKLQDILRDVRNERAPQWTNSTYIIGMVWGGAMANMLLERSSWEAFAGIWDGISAKKAYGMPDYWFAFVPWPPLINTMAIMGRKPFALRLAGLATGHQLYLQGLEKVGIDWLTNNFPEVWSVAIKKQLKETGIPPPSQTIECKLPKTKDKKTYKEGKFDWTYPNPDEFIQLDQLGVTFEDALEGVFTNITHESEGPFTHDNVISIGLGKNTKVLKE
ncbi:MAG: hypothetical protein HWN65_04765 [Candidatus Helarchaeota archaeon]|nr:hypothetical protein [Candidatus Helarchaeota archaeon]